MARRSDIDWPLIEKDFRAGFLTIRQMAAQHRVSASSIKLKAKQQGWTQNLTEAIKARAKAKIAVIDVADLIEQSAQQSANQSAQSIKTAIEAASDVVSGIVLKHRESISGDMARAKAIEMKLDEMLSSIAELKDLAMAASTYKVMVEAKGKTIAAERQIFGLDEDDKKEGNEIDSFLEKLNGKLMPKDEAE